MTENSLCKSKLENIIDDSLSDAKKARFEIPVSRVIHIRNIPTDSSDVEIAALGVPFGKVTNILRLNAKNQCFLELEDENKTRKMMNYYKYVAPNLRGHPVYMQYSNHTQLVTDSSRSKSSTEAAIAAAVAAISSSSPPLNPLDSEVSLKSNELMTVGSASPEAGRVLHISIDNLVYPVTLDILNQIFSKFGVVEKIITFTKNNLYQALIQFTDAVDAQNAKLSLDGQSIYYGCCTLKIDYSKLLSINVKYNNDKSRDFTKNVTTRINPTAGATSIAIPVASATSSLYASSILTSTAAALPTSLASYGSATILSPLTAIATTSPLQSTSDLLTAPIQQQLSEGNLGYDNSSYVGSVIHVTNLNEAKVTPRALFILFGVYGDVYRVKILFNKKDTALIQMAEPHQAQTAIAHLHGIQLYGKKMFVSSSKYAQVQLPKEPDPSGLTQDYSQSALHRFKKVGSRNFQNIYPPSATLHLSNIPPSVTEEDIKELFEGDGCTIARFRFFPSNNSSNNRMALLQMNSVGEATHSLIERHNYQIGSTYLRVSFSKTSL
ncbi:Polypyrimidine tract-binding protein 2 [Trichoplax sp. H2]|nr:Polypyrimidine tract-binding protein 2 [Trichoplax sp. H2]|eukprot:RDD43652.1 Polypyrimidine tract-binding protein 2 [Trichoplax sp. H2]